ncbi:hypothetical protein C4D60_Mb06t00940 [Musa balbisiana]|uniref:Uncharacterized protein n=1 Tax=Musa balbisiana TaxID=52838 RepID=A0A4S8IJR3_MUSBA|nr:hypothetical protein C4D60_Mb06t00940 [Musa balbisiana]
MGDPDADEENHVLKAEQDAQIGKDSRGDVTIYQLLLLTIGSIESYMDSEIRAIMAQYMPLENPEAQSHIRNDQI